MTRLQRSGRALDQGGSCWSQKTLRYVGRVGRIKGDEQVLYRERAYDRTRTRSNGHFNLLAFAGSFISWLVLVNSSVAEKAEKQQNTFVFTSGGGQR